MPTAFITGVNGQDGSYLSEFLLGKGYRVVGCVRNKAKTACDRLHAIREKVDIVQCDLLDQARIEEILKEYEPVEIYNFASHSFLSESFAQPVMTGEFVALGVTRILEAIRKVNPAIRFFQASSSEMFGKPAEVPQTETTPFQPRNPYGVAKVYGHLITANYREIYGLFACSGILFNHESPRRGIEFVTRKITHAAARIKLGFTRELPIGNLDARRDWGFAGDYVNGMWRMLQQTAPDDYVLSTGETHSVRELCTIAFERVGLDYRDHVVHQPESFRQAESLQLVGNPAKAELVLGWKRSVTFQDMIRMMVEADLEALK